MHKQWDLICVALYFLLLTHFMYLLKALAWKLCMAGIVFVYLFVCYQRYQWGGMQINENKSGANGSIPYLPQIFSIHAKRNI